jgi:hypothetical protein
MAVEIRDMWYIDHDARVYPVRAQRQSRDLWLVHHTGRSLELEIGIDLYENPIVAYERAIERVHNWLRAFVEQQTKVLAQLTDGLVKVTVQEVKERMQDDATRAV